MNSSRRLDRMKNVADECNSISADGSIGHSGSSSSGTGDGSSASVSTHTESHNSSEDGSTTGSSDRASSDESSGSGEDVTDDSSFSVILGNLDEIIEVDSSVKDVESSISSSSGSDLHDHDSDESHSSDEEADNGKDTSLDYVLDSFADTTLAVVEEVENAKDTSLDFVLDTFAVVESFARNSSFETEQADSRGASSDESSCSHSGIDEHSHDAVSDGESVDSGSEEIFESGCSSIENCSRSGYGDESVSDCSVSDTGGSCSSSSATNISCKSEGVQFDGIYDKKIISQCRDGKVKVTNVPFDELSNSSSGEEVTKKADKKRDNCTSTNDGSEKPSESPDSSEDRFPLVDLTKSTDERDCSPSSPDLPDPCFTSDTASIGALATKLKVTSILENISTTYYSTGGDLSTKTTAMNVVEIIGTCTAEIDTVSPDSSAPEDRHAINNECAGSFPEADNNLSSFDASALIREYVNASRERIAAILEEPTNNVIVNDKVTHATDDQESYPFNTVVSEINEVNMIRTSPLDDAFASPHRVESVDDSLYTLDADDALCLLGNKALVCHPDILDSVAVVEKSHSTPSAAAAAAIAALAAVGECGRTGNSHNIVSCGASDSGKCAAGLSDGVAAVDDNLSDPATSGLVERESASKSLEHTILSPKRTATIFAFYEPSSTSTKHSEAGHGDDVERDVHGGDADSGSVATAITAESNNVRKAISIDEKTSTATPPPSTSVHERDDNIVAEVFRDTAAAAADDTPLTVVNNCNGCHEGTNTLAIPCTSEEGGEYTKSSQKSTIFSFYEPTIIFTEHSKDVQGDHDKGDAVVATAGVESTEVRRSTFIGNTSSTAFHPSASEDERLQDIHQSFLDTTATDDTSPTPVMEGIGCHNGLDTLSTPSVQVREYTDTAGTVECESVSESLEHAIFSSKRTATIFAFYEPSSTSTKHSEAGHGDDVERDVHGGDADSGSVATAITAESNNVRKAISIDEKTSTASPPPSTSVHERDDNIVAEVFRDTAAAAADDTPLTVVNNCNGCHEGTNTLAIPCTSEEGGEYTKSSQKSTIFSFYEPTIIFTEHSKDVQGDHDKGDAVVATAGVESTEVRRSTFIGNTSSTAFHPSASEDERLQDIHQSFLDTTATDDTSPTPVMEGIGCHNGLDTLSTPSVQVREHATSSKKRTTFAFYEPTLSLAKHSEDARGGAETVDNDESNDAKKSPFIYTMLSPRDDHVVAQTFTGTSAAEDASSIPSPGQESKGLEGANKSETACIYDASVIIQAYVKASKKRVSAILGESINSDEEKEEEDNKSSTSINLNDPTANISSIPVPDNLAASNGAGDSIKMISVVDSNTCAERPFSLDACTLAKRYVKASKKRVAAILGESISTDEDEDDDRAMVMAVASESKVVDTIDTGNESPPQSVAEDITLVVDPDNLVREYINASKLRIAAILEESQSISTHVQTDHDLSDDVDGNTSTSISFPVKDNEKDSGTNLNNEAYSVKNDETNIGTNREKESDAILSADVHPTNTNATLSSKGRSTVTQVNSSSIWDYDIWVIMLVAVVMFGYKQESEDPFEMEATGRSDEPISFVPSSLVTRGISVFGSQTRASKYKSRPVILEKSDVSNDPLQTNQNTKTLTTINTKKSVSPIAKGSVIKNMKEGNGKDGNEKMSNVNNVSLVSKGISLFGQQTRAHRYNKRSVNMKKIIAKADEDKSTQRKTAFKESLSSSPGNHASKSMCQHDLWLVAILSLVMIVFKSLTLRKKQEGYVSSP